MPIPLRLDTDDIQVAFDLLSSDTSLQPGAQVTTPGGATLRFRARTPSGAATPGRLEFELANATPAAVEPLAGWLFERLRGRVPTLRVAGRPVPVEPEALRRALGEGVGRGG
jgi:hypothetical protein